MLNAAGKAKFRPFTQAREIRGEGAAMADAIAMAAPPDTPAYGKGGSVDWEGFHCLCFAGQMIVSKVPVSFCLTINWNGPDDKVAAMMQAYIAGAADVLAETAQAVG